MTSTARPRSAGTQSRRTLEDPCQPRPRPAQRRAGRPHPGRSVAGPGRSETISVVLSCSARTGPASWQSPPSSRPITTRTSSSPTRRRPPTSSAGRTARTRPLSEVAGYLTPVPGGAGPMATAALLQNTAVAAALRHTSRRPRAALPGSSRRRAPQSPAPIRSGGRGGPTCPTGTTTSVRA
ncbi:MAG: hypothetical protein ACRDPY_42840 [Streptosporangiaceae bacterium]